MDSIHGVRQLLLVLLDNRLRLEYRHFVLAALAFEMECFDEEELMKIMDEVGVATGYEQILPTFLLLLLCYHSRL